MFTVVIFSLWLSIDIYQLQVTTFLTLAGVAICNINCSAWERASDAGVNNCQVAGYKDKP
jgi:hypothetical protein